MVFGIFVVILVGLIVFFIIKDRKTSNNTYKNEYYSVSLPEKLTADEIYDYSTNLYLDKELVGYIEVNTPCTFCSSIDSIVANYFGMEITIKEKSDEQTLGEYKLVKVKIAFEQSAAEQANGETPAEDEVHYIYTNYKNTFIDLYLNPSYVSEDKIKSMIDSFKIN